MLSLPHSPETPFLLPVSKRFLSFDFAHLTKIHYAYPLVPYLRGTHSLEIQYATSDYHDAVVNRWLDRQGRGVQGRVLGQQPSKPGPGVRRGSSLVS
jgi:hypothetical protein